MSQIIGLVSTFTIIIPILLGVLANTKKTEIKTQFFLCFLVFGFLVDVGGWYTWYTHGQSSLHYTINFLYNIYSPIEAIFFLWFLSNIARSPVDNSAKVAMYTMLPLWLVLDVLLPKLNITFAFSFFDPAYNILVAFIAGITLLHLIEKEAEISINPFFWTLFGIFLYNFSSFFIMLLKFTDFAGQLWFLHDTMNIITYLFFAVGFWVHYKQPAILD